jgi:hypothetical protein
MDTRGEHAIAVAIDYSHVYGERVVELADASVGTFEYRLGLSADEARALAAHLLEAAAAADAANL